MKNISTKLFKQLLFTIIVISSCLSMLNVSAKSSMIEQQFEFEFELDKNSFSNSNRQYNRKRKTNTALKSMRWARNSQGTLLSKSDVIRAVKKRYNARVLKINLKKSHSIYSVRILMPSGKIKNIQINARR